MILSNKRITKTLIRLRGYAGWSASLLFANSRKPNVMITVKLHVKCYHWFIRDKWSILLVPSIIICLSLERIVQITYTHISLCTYLSVCCSHSTVILIGKLLPRQYSLSYECLIKSTNSPNNVNLLWSLRGRVSFNFPFLCMLTVIRNFKIHALVTFAINSKVAVSFSSG